MRCSVHVFIKGSSYILARTRREYLGEKPRTLAELTVNGELKCLPLKKAREDIEISLLCNSSPHACYYVANYCYISFVYSGYARSLLVL